MELFFNIIGLKFKIANYPYDTPIERLAPFCSELSYDNVDIVYNVKLLNDSFDLSGNCILRTDNQEIYQTDNKYIMVWDFQSIKNDIKCYTVFEYGSSNVDIVLPESFFDIVGNQQLFMTILAFDFIILSLNRIMMHASIVKCNSEVILFTGPSGIGKSTQANLWKKFANADILNGDRAAIDISENIVKAYGSPYAGSSRIYRNEVAPVKAIILLKQSKSNSLKQLTKKEAYKQLFSRFSLIRWNNQLITNSMDIISRIIESVPVYLLSCYPGKDAVDLVYKTIYGNQNDKNGNFM